jgi:Lrp/AsnC family transcriptional regulator for asnA, asnC and gidA
MKKDFTPDDIDLKILSILMQDAKKTYSEIGKELFISGGTVHVRIKKMIDSNVIINSQLKVDHAKLGFDITAFLGIYLQKSNLYDSVSEQLSKIPEVVEAHYTTGVYSIFAKVIAKDTKHLRRIISHKIQQISEIQRTETFISLDNSINRPLKIVLEEPVN